MKRLTVPVAAIKADGFIIDVVAPIAELQPADADGGVPVSTVFVRGMLSEAGKEYLFRGNISGVFEAACDRCLEMTKLPFDVEVAWVFAEGQHPVSEEELDADDADEQSDVSVLGFDGNEIELATGVWEEVILAMPSKYVCREDCAGLCPACGTNLNRGRCSCRGNDGDGAVPGERPMGNKGLAGLAELFPDLRPKRSEE